MSNLTEKQRSDISAAMMGFMFEIKDKVTLNAVRSKVEAVLGDPDRYIVICDENNNSMGRSDLVVDVYGKKDSDDGGFFNIRAVLDRHDVGFDDLNALPVGMTA